MTLSNPIPGHAPGLPAITRRSLLQASAALAVPALGSADTPIQRMFRQWVAWIDDANANRWTDEVYDARSPERHAWEKAIEREPATDLADLAVKVPVLTGEGCWGLPNAVVLECARLVGRDFDRMPRCLFEDAAS